MIENLQYVELQQFFDFSKGSGYFLTLQLSIEGRLSKTQRHKDMNKSEQENAVHPTFLHCHIPSEKELAMASGESYA